MPTAMPRGARSVKLGHRVPRISVRWRRESLDAVAAAVEPDDETVCLVTHGGVLRVLAARLLRLGARGFDLDADNASLSVIRRDEDGGDWTLERWNDVHHLLGAVTTHVDERDGRPLAL